MTTNQYGFGLSGFSWDNYDAHRPEYPPSLWTMIFDHHNSHHGSCDTAHDTGTGSGVAAAKLSQHFGQVSASDPSAYNIESAKARLESLNIHNVTFAQHPAEHLWLEEASLDMVTIFEAIHWTDEDVAVQRAARTLKPGGTLALVFYSVECSIEGDSEAEELWKNALATLEWGEAGVKASRKESIGLDFVSVPTDLFEEGTRRVYINANGRRSRAFKLGGFEVSELAENRVAVTDKLVDVEEDGGWTKMVEPSWFRSYIISLQSNFSDGERRAEHSMIDQLESMLGQRHGSIPVTWHAEVVLATRRV